MHGKSVFRLWVLGSLLWATSYRLPASVAEDLELRKRADQLAHKYIIVDTHEDVPGRVRRTNEDISQRTKTGNFDYPRARRGGLDAVFMAVYVPPRYEQNGARQYADDMIDMIEGWAARWPDKFALAYSPSDIKKQFGTGRISLVIAIENGAPIEGNLANLEHFRDRGVSYITLVHSENNHICDSSYDRTRKWHGLSPFGRRLVGEMNRLGIMIDVSHVSDETFYQVIELSKAPVIASHSSVRHFTPGWERNMDDRMIKLLAEKGGVIQINFGSMFVSGRFNRQRRSRSKRIAELVKARNLRGAEKEAFTARYIKEHPVAQADISDVVANIEHVVKLVGIDHVGLGSDFDGVGDNLPRGLEDVSGFVNLIYELLKKGYSEPDIEKICSGNILRVWSQVRRAAVAKCPDR